MAKHQSLAQDLFKDMRKVAEASTSQDGEGGSKVVDEIESLCMNCHENGTTRLLHTKIPFFRKLVLMSFERPHCHWKNSKIQSARELQQRGVKLTIRTDPTDDPSRQTIKSDTAMFRIEDMVLEIPPGRGQLEMVAQDLEQKQDERKQVVPEVYEKFEGVVDKIRQMTSGQALPSRSQLTIQLASPSLEPPTTLSAGEILKK